MPSRKTPTRNVNGRRKDLVAMLERISPAHGSRSDFFRDCMELWAITVNNQIAGGYKFDEREARYLEVAKRYDSETLTGISRAFGLFLCITATEAGDVLGDLYMGLGLGNDHTGQFFTPTDISKFMNAMVLVTNVESELDQRKRSGEPYTAHDPAVGAGSTLLTGADLLDESGIDFRDTVDFSGVDIDRTCAHMAFLQMAARDTRAVIYHGNSLSMEMWDAWMTPRYVRHLTAKAADAADTQADEKPAA